MQKRPVLRTLGAGTLVLALAVTVAGCSTSSSNTDGGTGGPQTLSVLFPQTHAGASAILKEGFEKANPGVTVDVTLVPYDELQQKATLDVQSGASQFDVFDSWYTTIGALADGDVIASVDDLEKDANASDFIPAIYDPYSLVNGKRYGLPFDGDTEVLFYNKEILDRNGITPPKTWDEYNAAVAKITANEKVNGVYGAAIMGQQAPIILGSTYANRLAGFGGSFLDAKGKPTLDTPEAIGAAKSLLAVIPDALPTPAETAFDQALAAFLGGKVGFMEFWTDLGTFAQDPSQSKIIDKWGVSQLPVGGNAKKSLASLDAGFTMTLSSAAKNTDLAKKFILYATSEKTNLQLITTTGSGIDPNRVSTLNSPEYKAFAPLVQPAASASLSGALPWPTSSNSPKLLQVLTDALAKMISTNGDPTATMQAVQKEWEGIIG